MLEGKHPHFVVNNAPADGFVHRALSALEEGIINIESTMPFGVRHMLVTKRYGHSAGISVQKSRSQITQTMRLSILQTARLNGVAVGQIRWLIHLGDAMLFISYINTHHI